MRSEPIHIAMNAQFSAFGLNHISSKAMSANESSKNSIFTPSTIDIYAKNQSVYERFLITTSKIRFSSEGNFFLKP